MLHRDRVHHKNSLTGPGNLFTFVFIILAFGYGIFMTRGFSPSLKEVNPEQSQYLDSLPEAAKPGQDKLQLNKFGAIAKPVNADCQQIPFVTGTPKPNMIYAISPEPETTISQFSEIKVWYNDLLPMMIGDDRYRLGLSPLTRSPDHIINPQFGDRPYDITEWNYVGPIYDFFGNIIDYLWEEVHRQTYVPQDENKFPYFPAIFVTDITGSPSNRSGDAQSIILNPPLPLYPEFRSPWPNPHSPPPPPYTPNWPPYPLPFPYPNKPFEINGTWGKFGDTVIKNGINIGQPFDASGTNEPYVFTEEFPVVSNIRMPNWNYQNRIMEYSTELIWNARSLQYSNGSSAYTTGLLSGHRYRLQIIVRNITGTEIAQGCINYQIE